MEHIGPRKLAFVAANLRIAREITREILAFLTERVQATFVALLEKPR